MGSTQSFEQAQPDHYHQRLSQDSRDQVDVRNNGQPSEHRTRPALDAQPAQKHHHGGDRDFHVPREVFDALQAELAKSEEKRDLYAEKYDKLKDKYRKIRDIAQEQKEDLDHSQTTVKWLEKLLLKILNRYLSPYVEENGDKLDEWTVDSTLTVLDRMFQDAKDAKSLQEQVRVLQRELLAKVDKVQAVSDQQFALDFRSLISLVKTLSRTTRLIEVVDPVAALGEGLLLEGVSPCHWSSRARKKSLIEAWVWSVLVELVFRSPFAILGKDCDSLGETWQNVFFLEHFQKWPTPTTLCETWRYTTMERMLSLVHIDVITNGMIKGTDLIVEPSILGVRETVRNKIGTALAKISVSPDMTQVQNIIDKAFSVALQMSLQRYRLQITWPRVGDIFCDGEMSAMPNLDDGDDNKGTVAFIVNPGLTKWGDTHGGHFDQRFNIVQPLVQLESKTTEQEKQEFLEVWEMHRELDELSVSRR
jgi:hypothetical protein